MIADPTPLRRAAGCVPTMNPMEARTPVAYFSMEIGLEAGIPSYAGGLGVLAGDTVRAAADLGIPMVAVTLLHRSGYVSQQLGPDGWQQERPATWVVEDWLEPAAARCHVTIEGRRVTLRAWRYSVRGVSGHSVPVYFLDADVPENAEHDRRLTDHLYGGDLRYRLCQEVILGIGGTRFLRAAGHDRVHRFHMNEGHCALLVLELLDERMARTGGAHPTAGDVDAVRELCAFTTHTPVEAGHEQLPLPLVEHVLGRQLPQRIRAQCCTNDLLHMTWLALNMSSYVNGVSRRHGEVSRRMFSGHAIDAITNGVHAGEWASPEMAALFDRDLPGWRDDPFALRGAVHLRGEDVWAAHAAAKSRLLGVVNERSRADMSETALTLGFARRATAYKRPALIFTDLDRLREVARRAGTIQLIFAGKSHPRDEGGKELIRHIVRAGEILRPEVRVAYLADYDMDLARLMTAGVDVWLNNPRPPLEASGTSGMKAALNGVPSLSTLDGWWVEGWMEGVTGWSIGGAQAPSGDGIDVDRHDATLLYDKLEREVLPAFHGPRERLTDIMRHTIALNGSFFHAHRMLQQYAAKAYL
jgi:starch phosphorylase